MKNYYTKSLEDLPYFPLLPKASNETLNEKITR